MAAKRFTLKRNHYTIFKELHVSYSENQSKCKSDYNWVGYRKLYIWRWFNYHENGGYFSKWRQPQDLHVSYSENQSKCKSDYNWVGYPNLYIWHWLNSAFFQDGGQTVNFTGKDYTELF